MTSTLTTDQLADVRAQLITAKAELLVQAGVLAETDATLATARMSQEERAKSAGDADLLGVERDNIATVAESFRQGLDAIDSALDRLAAGTYGRCTECRGEIPAARLLARPRSTTCVPCASGKR